MPEGTACPAQARDRFKWEREFRDSGLDVTSQAIGLWIATYANRNGSNAHPGIARLVEHTSTSRATVKRRIALLVEGGWLIRTSRGSQSGRQALSDVFQLAVPVAVDQSSTGDGSGLSEAEIRAQSCEPLPRPSHHEDFHHSAKRSLPREPREDQPEPDPDEYSDESDYLHDKLVHERGGRALPHDVYSRLFNMAAEGAPPRLVENTVRKMLREFDAQHSEVEVPRPRVTKDNYADLVMAVTCPRCGARPSVYCVGLGWGGAHGERFDQAEVPHHFAA